MDEQLSQPTGYRKLLEDIKARIQTAQVRAGLAVNRELVLLYWSIGREILTRQDREGWGAKVIESLARDLHFSFPEIKGLSPRNLKYMRAFAEAWTEEPIEQAALAQIAQITGYHNLALLEKIHTNGERLWYVQQTAVDCWRVAAILSVVETCRRLEIPVGRYLMRCSPPWQTARCRPCRRSRRPFGLPTDQCKLNLKRVQSWVGRTDQ